MENLTGKRVETCVYVCGERIPMRHGIVTRYVTSDVCEVDIGSLHGCAPWLVLEPACQLLPVNAN